MIEILTFLKEEVDKSNGIENITEEQQKEIKKKLEKHFKGSGIIDCYLIIREQVETVERMIQLSNGTYDIETVQLLRENHEKLFSYKINLESFNLKARRTEHLYQFMQEIRAIAGYFSDKFYFLLCNVLFE